MNELVARLAQRVTRAGEMKLAPALLEELDLERLGELLELQRHRRLREMQLLGGASDAAEAGHRLENQQLGQQPMSEQTARAHARHLGSLR